MQAESIEKLKKIKTNESTAAQTIVNYLNRQTRAHTQYMVSTVTY